MRLSTITNWAYGATVALTFLSGTTMLLASSAEQRERAAVAQRLTFDQLTARMEEDIYRLSEHARGFIITGNDSHLIAFNREKAALESVENRIRHLRDAGADHSELAALRDALQGSDALVDEQEVAIDAARKGDRETAREIIFGDAYGREMDRIAGQVSRFQYMLGERTEQAVKTATLSARQWRTMSEIGLGITALLFLCVLYFILKQRILHPVVRLSDVVTRLAAQDYDAIPPDFRQVDEIGDMAQAIRVFRENGLERLRLEQERDADRAMRDLLARLMQRLQECDTMRDLVEVVRRFAPEIAPGFAGRLYILDAERNKMVEACAWLSPTRSRPEFMPTACWGLRRAQTHRPQGMTIDISCDHLGDGEPVATLCIPLIAQGKSIGLLYVEASGDSMAGQEQAEQYLEMLAENIGLALVNLQLRDALRDMAMTDALTALPNRRQFDIILRQRIDDAERDGTSLCCLMIDIDWFKRFNDSHGHDAGDDVLRAVGRVLSDSLREHGHAFRLGGEEFVVLMPGFTIEQALARATSIQERIRALRVEFRGTPLGPITASFGLAAFPEHGPADRLLQAADATLLRAKAEGRDRILVATTRGARSSVA